MAQLHFHHNLSYTFHSNTITMIMMTTTSIAIITMMIMTTMTMIMITIISIMIRGISLVNNIKKYIKKYMAYKVMESFTKVATAMLVQCMKGSDVIGFIIVTCRVFSACVPGAHFTNNFSITIQMWWKFHFVLIQILISDRYNIWHMARQLGCRGMCQILLRYNHQ